MSSDITYHFNGKRALVTGAGRGIGRALAIELAKGGAETYALSKTKDNLDSLVKEYPSIHAVCVDLADWTATRQAVEALPPIDLLVNNAAIIAFEKFVDAKPEEFDDIMNINVKALMNVSQVVVKSMIARGAPGSIVNLSTQASIRAFDAHTIYSASKGAVDMVTRTMALELGPHQIRVNSVNPTVVLTDMGRHWDTKESGQQMKQTRIPLRRFAEEADIVGPILFLLTDAARMMTGAMVMVDGGLTIT
jgi:L-xylulose reductase